MSKFYLSDPNINTLPLSDIQFRIYHYCCSNYNVKKHEAFIRIVNIAGQFQLTKNEVQQHLIDLSQIKHLELPLISITEKQYISFDMPAHKKFLESNNIFPSIPIKQKILFIPIIIDENKKDLLIFSDNKIFNEWNTFSKSSYLLEYILPTEDLEDLNIIKNKFETIEQYDFKDITAKYDLKDSIVALIFKNEKEIRVLSRILIKDNLIAVSINIIDLYA